MVVSVLGRAGGRGFGNAGAGVSQPISFLMRRVYGHRAVPGEHLRVQRVAALIVPGDILIICGGSFLICLLAAAFPVWNAGCSGPWRHCAMSEPKPEAMVDAARSTNVTMLGARSLEVLRGVSLKIARGDFLALRGASGAQEHPAAFAGRDWTHPQRG